MTKDTFRLLIESPELLGKIEIEEFRTLTPRDIKDMPEPKLLVSELGAFGVPLAIVFPMDDYIQLFAAIQLARQSAESITGSLSGKDKP